MNIVAFLGETFSKIDGFYYAKQTSAAFLQDTFGCENVVVCSPAISVFEKPERYSSVVAHSKFYEFPGYSSTKEFVFNCLFIRGYFRKFLSMCDYVITINPEAVFWIRSPSVGSLVFGMRCLKLKRKLLHHMCADVKNTWRDKKYKGIEKIAAYLFSNILLLILKRICGNPNTINFCTGDKLEKFSKKYSPENTHQFVDLMIDKSDLKGSERKENSPLKMLFVGRVVEDKGIFDAIKLVSELRGEVVLTLVGDGPDLEKAKKFSNALGLGGAVVFTGQLPHKELDSYYSDCDLILVPSNNNYEGFPRVIMEAWLYEKPVVVSNVGGVNAFVVDGENGVVFQPGNFEELLSKIKMLTYDFEYYENIKSGASIMSKISTKKYWIDKLIFVLDLY